jgi:hypothetical protein
VATPFMTSTNPKLTRERMRCGRYEAMLLSKPQLGLVIHRLQSPPGFQFKRFGEQRTSIADCAGKLKTPVIHGFV